MTEGYGQTGMRYLLRGVTLAVIAAVALSGFQGSAVAAGLGKGKRPARSTVSGRTAKDGGSQRNGSTALGSSMPKAARDPDDIVGTPWTGERGITVTTADLMARQAAKDAAGFVEPPFTHDERDLDYELPADPRGPLVARYGIVPNARPEAPAAAPIQTLGLNFLADQYGNLVPPDAQAALGPTQFLSATNRSVRTYNKSTGAADPALNVTLNTFFSSVNGGQSTFDVISRYDPTSQRFIVTAEDGLTPNHIFIAVSNTSTITSASAWTFYSFLISTVSPAGDATCFADYPSMGVDANALIIGVNNFCPSSYASSAIYVVRKSSILSGGPIVVTAFRNIGQVTPRGIDNWDADPSGTAPSYVISPYTTSSVRLRRISTPGGTPTLSGGLDVVVPTFTSPLALEHLGNAHPGGTYNGRLDASDTRFMPSLIRNGVLWATHGCGVNSSGVASSADRDAVRWYQITSLGTTPALAQAGTIFDTTTTNPLSYTYGTVAVTGQGHAVFGFSVVGAAIYASAGYTARLANDAAGFTNTPQIIVSGVGAYNAFDQGTSRPERWGDYSQTMVDPSDDMTIWTAQEYTAQANTSGSSNAQWGTRAAQIKAPPPATPTAATPSTVAPTSSVSVVIAGSSASGSGFYDGGSSFPNRIAAAVSPGGGATGSVSVTGIAYTDPTHVTLTLSTLGASGNFNVTITNPDGQQATSASTILAVDPLLPIQLASLTGRYLSSSGVNLEWTTVSEINNYGFEVQSAATSPGEFKTIPGSFLPGHGTTNLPHTYRYVDASSQPGPFYRLKQMDLDGSVNYSEAIEITMLSGPAQNATPTEFSLDQNFPNPFNPSTMIKYGLPVASHVRLTVFNALGQKMATLVDGDLDAGYHEAVFENTALSSGVYFYTIEAGPFRATKKLLLLR